MLDTLLGPFDYPRQAAYNLGRSGSRFLEGTAGADDLRRAIPGLLGLGAGAIFGPLAGLGAGAALQGLSSYMAPETFAAPTAGDLVETLGGDRDSMLQTTLAHLATDPLSYAGALGTYQAGKQLWGGGRMGSLGEI